MRDDILYRSYAQESLSRTDLFNQWSNHVKEVVKDEHVKKLFENVPESNTYTIMLYVDTAHDEREAFNQKVKELRQQPEFAECVVEKAKQHL